MLLTVNDIIKILVENGINKDSIVIETIDGIEYIYCDDFIIRNAQ